MQMTMQFMQYAVLLCLFTDFHFQSLYCCKSGLQTHEEMGLNLPKEVLYALTILNRNASTELGRLIALAVEACANLLLVKCVYYLSVFAMTYSVRCLHWASKHVLTYY